MLAACALSPAAHAQLPSPTPDGGYPGNNTAEGTDALANVQINTDTGDGLDNTALGSAALKQDTTGNENTATGSSALHNNTTGNGNTANGEAALLQNTTGTLNTAAGANALLLNTTGSYNTATGAFALSNFLGDYTTASYNTADGAYALASNTTGTDNAANGVAALYSNTEGSLNTANGSAALYSNTTGSVNTANGFAALYSNTTGSNNIALGEEAGKNLTTGANNIDIGNFGVAGEANAIRIGTQGTQKKTFIAGIRGSAVSSGTTVVVNAAGKLGVAPSSARFKHDVRSMDKASEAILALKPVTFRYKEELDPDGTAQFGLIAEEVAKVNPDLVARDDQGKIYTVRYDAVNAMLLNEFLKERHKVQELRASDAEQKKQIAELKQQLHDQAEAIHKVSERVELSALPTQVVANQQ